MRKRRFESNEYNTRQSILSKPASTLTSSRDLTVNISNDNDTESWFGCPL